MEEQGKIHVLLQMLTYKRPDNSLAEEEFVTRFIDPYNPTTDEAGNRYLTVDLPGGGVSTTMFSCHTDTVHRVAGRQQIDYDPELGIISKSDKECLGADDGAGIWLMLQMYEAKVPGLYVFHRGEECGGLGSAAAAKATPDFFKMFDRCIALDRKGYSDVITHQSRGRCCSEDFANALAAELNKDKLLDLDYRPCSTGVFTDSAHYTDLIGECTNLSVGYEAQHTEMETQDTEHLQRMLEALLKVEWEKLPTVRKKGEVESRHLEWYAYPSQNSFNYHSDARFGQYHTSGIARSASGLTRSAKKKKKKSIDTSNVVSIKSGKKASDFTFPFGSLLALISTDSGSARLLLTQLMSKTGMTDFEALCWFKEAKVLQELSVEELPAMFVEPITLAKHLGDDIYGLPRSMLEKHGLTDWVYDPAEDLGNLPHEEQLRAWQAQLELEAPSNAELTAEAAWFALTPEERRALEQPAPPKVTKGFPLSPTTSASVAAKTVAAIERPTSSTTNNHAKLEV